MIGFITLISAMIFDFSQILHRLDIFLISLFSLAFSAIFILEFYEFISTKNIFHPEGIYHSVISNFKEERIHENVARIFAFFEYIFFFPLIVFFWAGVFFIILVISSESLVANSIPHLQNTFMLSVSIVGAIRICAYYRRKIAEDLSKLLPLVLVGNFVIRDTRLSFNELVLRFESVGEAFFVPEFQAFVLQYLVLLIILEFFLRVVNMVKDYHYESKEHGNIVEEDLSSKDDGKDNEEHEVASYSLEK
ncbi:MAG: hypothetical protein ACOCTT_00245 [archaeon]